MVRVRVIDARGASLRGPVTVKLTKKQWARRVALLGAVPSRLKEIKLDGGKVLNFKYGEEFEVDGFEGRLNTALFEDLDAKAEAEAEAKAKAEAEAEAAANEPGGDD